MKRTVRCQGAILRGDEILLIRHREHDTGRSYWIVPGGGQEDGESEEACVEREMLEETNLNVKAEKLLVEEPGHPGGTYERERTYLCRIVSGEARPGYEPEEEVSRWYAIVETKWYPLSSPEAWPLDLKSDKFSFPLLLKIREALARNGDIMKGLRIETERLRIRAFSEKDAEDLHEYLSDPSVYVYEPGSPIDLLGARKLAKERALETNFLAVELKESGKMVGHLFFKQIAPDERMTWELGYIFSPRHQGKGYATEAAKAIVAHAFESLAAHRIFARCNPANIASWKLLEKAGFVREGHFRQCAFFRRDGEGSPLWHDAYEYAILESDPPRGSATASRS